MSAAHEVALTVNGRPYQRPVEARLSLADFLRDDLGLTGTHVGCEHGVCGACTILMDGRPVRSCLLFAVQADGSELTTIEGLAALPAPPGRGAGGAGQEEVNECSTASGSLPSPTAMASRGRPLPSAW